jgi:hypothetical protein
LGRKVDKFVLEKKPNPDLCPDEKQLPARREVLFISKKVFFEN